MTAIAALQIGLASAYSGLIAANVLAIADLNTGLASAFSGLIASAHRGLASCYSGLAARVSADGVYDKILYDLSHHTNTVNP